MSTTEFTPRKVYTADGVTSRFAITFAVDRNADVLVELVRVNNSIKTLVPNQDYVIDAGEVVMRVDDYRDPPAAGEVIVIRRSMPIFQPTTRAAISPSVFRQRLESLTRVFQQLREQLDRTLHVGQDYPALYRMSEIYTASVLTSVSPDEIVGGGPTFVITLTGTGFAPSAVARFDGTELVTIFVSSTSLTATVPAALISSAVGTVDIDVRHGGFISNTVPFNILQAIVVVVGAGQAARSLNGGHTWVAATTPPSVASSTRDDCFSAIYDSARERFFSPAGARSIWLSTDGGDVWIETQNALPNIGMQAMGALYVEPHDAIVVYGTANSDSGLCVSLDGGDNWTSITLTGFVDTFAAGYDPDTDTVVVQGANVTNTVVAYAHCPADDLATGGSWTVVADDTGSISTGGRCGAAYFPSTGRMVIGHSDVSGFVYVVVSNASNDYSNFTLTGMGGTNSLDTCELVYFVPTATVFGVFFNISASGCWKSTTPHSSPWSEISTGALPELDWRCAIYLPTTGELLVGGDDIYYSSDVTAFTQSTSGTGVWRGFAAGVIG